MFHGVWKGYNEPLKLENDTNSDLQALKWNLVMDEKKIFQKIILSLPFNLNIMH